MNVLYLYVFIGGFILFSHKAWTGWGRGCPQGQAQKGGLWLCGPGGRPVGIGKVLFIENNDVGR